MTLWMQARVKCLAFLGLKDAIVRCRIGAHAALLKGEHFLEIRARQRPVEAEKHEALAVGSGEAAAVKGEQALVRTADQIGVGVEMYLLVAAEPYFEQAVLDLLRGAGQERKCVDLRHVRCVRQIKNARNRAERIEKRHSRAAQNVVHVEEVLAAQHRDRMPLRERCPDGVGSSPSLVPSCPCAQRHTRRIAGELALAETEEHHALRIGENDNAVGHAGVAEQRFQFAARRPHQTLVALLGLAQLMGRENAYFRHGLHIEAALDAALPGSQNRQANLCFCVDAFTQEAAPRRNHRVRSWPLSHERPPLLSFSLGSQLSLRQLLRLASPIASSSRMQRIRLFPLTSFRQ